jgi:hypothetical protein
MRPQCGNKSRAAANEGEDHMTRERNGYRTDVRMALVEADLHGVLLSLGET